MKIGAAGGIRTPDLLVRSQALYPTELRPRAVKAHIYVGPRAESAELPWNQEVAYASPLIRSGHPGSSGETGVPHGARILSHRRRNQAGRGRLF
jgi:hypothetical protein